MTFLVPRTRAGCQCCVPPAPLLAGPHRRGASGGECAIAPRFCINSKKKNKPHHVLLLWFWALSNRQLFPSALQWGVEEHLFSLRWWESGGIMRKSVRFIWCETIFWHPFVPKPLWCCQPRWAVSLGFSRQFGSSIHNFSWAKHQLNWAPTAGFLAFFLSNPFCFLYYHQKKKTQQKTKPSICRNL